MTDPFSTAFIRRLYHAGVPMEQAALLLTKQASSQVRKSAVRTSRIMSAAKIARSLLPE